jgi:hypothetical protein
MENGKKFGWAMKIGRKLARRHLTQNEEELKTYETFFFLFWL